MTNKISDPIHGKGIGSLSDRLLELIGSQSVRSFAQSIGVSETAVRKYLKGAIPGLDIALKIAEHGGVNLEWFATGRGPKFPTSEHQTKPVQTDKPDADKNPTITLEEFNEEFVLIPGYHIQVSTGNGCHAFDELPKRYLAFRRKYLKYKNLDPNKLAIVFAKGDSMGETIKDNDTLLVDLNAVKPIDGKIFIIRLGDELYAKRIQKSYDGSIRLISDNKDYAPIVVPKEELNQLCIVGRAVQCATDL